MFKNNLDYIREAIFSKNQILVDIDFLMAFVLLCLIIYYYYDD